MTTRAEEQATWAGVYAGLTASQRRVADDISVRARDNASQQLQWAEELVSLVDLLVASDAGAMPWPVVRMFWVRLHGVVTELIDAHAKTVELANALSEDELERSLARFALSIHRAATSVLAALDESEVVVADYFRQRAVHLRQNGYALELPRSRGRSDYAAIFSIFSLMNLSSNSIGLT